MHYDEQTIRGLFRAQPGHTRSSGSGPFSLASAASAGKQRPSLRLSRWSRKALNLGFEPARSKGRGLDGFAGGSLEHPMQ